MSALRSDSARNIKMQSSSSFRNHIYNRLPVLQISMFRSSSQDLFAASAKTSKAIRSLVYDAGYRMMQSMTTCCTDCVMCPPAFTHGTITNDDVPMCRISHQLSAFKIQQILILNLTIDVSGWLLHTSSNNSLVLGCCCNLYSNFP